MSRRLHKYLFYTLLAVVYGVFFSVDSFYNFEGHSDARNIVSHASLVRHAAGNRGLSTSSSPYPSAHALRLNKRYQQKNFIPCPVFRVEMPVCYVGPARPAAYPVCPLPFITVVHSPLRGPPTAV